MHRMSTMTEALAALERIGPLLSPDLFAVRVSDGPGGWSVTLIGPEGQACDRLAARLGLHEQPERAEDDAHQQTRYRGGRAGRVEVTLATATHAVRRVGARR